MVKMIIYKDEVFGFFEIFNEENGTLFRSDINGVDPVMRSFPELLDVGIMGHCKSISESMNSKTLREIWQGDKFVAFREQRKEKCSSCRQMELCRGGCRLGIDIDMC